MAVAALIPVPPLQPSSARARATVPIAVFPAGFPDECH